MALVCTVVAVAAAVPVDGEPGQKILKRSKRSSDIIIGEPGLPGADNGGKNLHQRRYPVGGESKESRKPPIIIVDPVPNGGHGEGIKRRGIRIPDPEPPAPILEDGSGEGPHEVKEVTMPPLHDRRALPVSEELSPENVVQRERRFRHHGFGGHQPEEKQEPLVQKRMKDMNSRQERLRHLHHRHHHKEVRQVRQSNDPLIIVDPPPQPDGKQILPPKDEKKDKNDEKNQKNQG